MKYGNGVTLNKFQLLIGGIWPYACLESDVARSEWFIVMINICPRATPNYGFENLQR
jgi:hypothetical protein